MATSHPELAQVIRLIDASEKESAVTLLRQLLERDPNNIQALIWLGGLTPDVDEGIIILERVLQIEPGNAIAKRGLVDLQTRRQAQRVAKREDVLPEHRRATASRAEASKKSLSAAEPEAIADDSIGTGDHLRIVEGGSYLLEQERRKHRQSTALGWVLSILLLVMMIWGIVFIVKTVTEASRLPVWWTVGAIGLELICSRLLPVVERLRSESRNFAAGRRGEERLVELLQHHLDGRWTLFRNLVLPGAGGDIDAVLAGPRGVFALEVKAYTGYNRNSGMEWQRRIYGRWRNLDQNPTRQILRNAALLGEYLKRAGQKVWVEPRIVWAGRGKLWLERPAVYVWQLSDPVHLLENVGKGKSLSETVVAKVVALLEAIRTGERNSDRKP